jgi:hypothetical protein
MALRARYLRRVEERPHRLPSALSVLRLALVVFVLSWLFGPHALRSAVPIWIVFLIALGLEVQFFVGGMRAAPARLPDRGPQAVDRERYGYGEEEDEEDEELWIPYGGEEDDEDELEWASASALAEPRRLGLPVRRFLVGLGVIGALALVIWFVESRTGWDALDAETRARAAARFSDEASRIAAKPVTVRCDESGRYVGAVQHSDGAAIVGGDLAYLTPARCLDLYRLAFKGESASSQTARALAVLAHEAWHLRGVADEGTTECYALQTGVELGRRLGLSEGTARRLMRQQLTENALRGRGSVEYLVPPDCRNGGRLDLNQDLSRFP